MSNDPAIYDPYGPGEAPSIAEQREWRRLTERRPPPMPSARPSPADSEEKESDA